MTPEQSRNELITLIPKAAFHVNLLVVARTEDDLTIQRVSLTERLSRDFRDDCVTALFAEGSLPELAKYVAGYTPEAHEICYTPLSEMALVESVVQDISRPELAEIFKETEDVVRHLHFYAIVLDFGTRKAVFFRRFGSVKELSKSRFKPVTLLNREVYDRMEQRVFLFDSEVDCFSWDEYMFIRNVTGFQRIFRYFEALEKKADETLKFVSPKVPIKNQTEFERVCKGNPLMLAKLAQIAKKPYLDKVTMEDIKRTIDEFKLHIQVENDNGTEKLVFELSPSKRWMILKLLDDDYLGSSMTRYKYAASSKRPV